MRFPYNVYLGLFSRDFLFPSVHFNLPELRVSYHSLYARSLLAHRM
jgi:hypothetical protein